MTKSCNDQALADVHWLEENMRERLAWSNVKLLRAILVFLDTQTWRPLNAVSGESDSESESSANDKSLAEVTVAVDFIATTFREPLEAVGVNLLTLQDQITEVVEYARNYLLIETEDYHRMWYKLHVCPDSNRWANVLVLCELCFSLSFSNGTVERVFSALKLIKTDWRTRLHSDTLSDLLEIQVEGASLEIFSPTQAVQTWWQDCKSTRRPNQGTRKHYAPRAPA